MFWNFIFNLFMQFGQTRPMHSLLMMMRSMITQVARGDIVKAI